MWIQDECGWKDDAVTIYSRAFHFIAFNNRRILNEMNLFLASNKTKQSLHYKCYRIRDTLHYNFSPQIIHFCCYMENPPYSMSLAPIRVK